jgi:hypothetical protein
MKYSYLILLLIGLCLQYTSIAKEHDLHLTLIPPGMITNQVPLDIRAGLKNHTAETQRWSVEIYLDKVKKKNLLYNATHVLQAGGALEIKHVIPKGSLLGRHTIILKVRGARKNYIVKKEVEVVAADMRSTQTIDGAWAGIYHWSEVEGKHWNGDIRQLTDDQWKTMVGGMRKLGMDMVVIQEVFRNDAYAGKHQLTPENYPGKSFYPSALYSARMDITAKDPVEAILAAADSLGMHVWVGVGLFAWFDFSPASLEWHKRVAGELWQRYGHHPSFYGFYVSEEMGGSLDNWETTDSLRQFRKKEMIHFFKEFRQYCSSIAPAKPIMLATNSMQVPMGADAYPGLLQYLDVLCPFGFARMPENDLTGKEAADLLQSFCDAAGAHLWFDLEAFLFNPDTSLYPRDMEGILGDLTMFKNFEKILCYQYPGVFSDPAAGFRVGEVSTIPLFEQYQLYQQKQRDRLKQATAFKQNKKKVKK